jgi:beta-phosphoglucomutase
VTYKGIVFDLDGVIVHTDKMHYLAWRSVAEELGFPFTERDNSRFRGVSRMECMDILAEIGGLDLSPDEKLRLATLKNERYRELLRDLGPKDVSPDVSRTLDALRAQGVKTAIGSSSRNARDIVRYLGLEAQFDALVDGNDITRSKPHPEVFQKAIAALGLQPGQCAVVEDAVAGIEAAKAAGAAAVAIGDARTAPGADAKIDTLWDLMTL